MLAVISGPSDLRHSSLGIGNYFTTFLPKIFVCQSPVGGADMLHHGSKSKFVITFNVGTNVGPKLTILLMLKKYLIEL